MLVVATMSIPPSSFPVLFASKARQRRNFTTVFSKSMPDLQSRKMSHTSMMYVLQSRVLTSVPKLYPLLQKRITTHRNKI